MATIASKTTDDIRSTIDQSMKSEGLEGDPLDVVTINGETVSLDNRRLYAARAAGIEAPVLVHKPTDALPATMEGRSSSEPTSGATPQQVDHHQARGRCRADLQEGHGRHHLGGGGAFRTANRTTTDRLRPLMGAVRPRSSPPRRSAPGQARRRAQGRQQERRRRLQTKAIVRDGEGNLDKDLFSKKAADGSTYGDWYKKWIEAPSR
jgi:hypothetical protein